jgi:hypothetical protein
MRRIQMRMRKSRTCNLVTGPVISFRPVIIVLLTVALAFSVNGSPGNDSKKTSGRKDVKRRSPISNFQRCLHGGIEIGASGVKAIAIRVNETDEGYNATEIFTPKVANTNVMDGVEKTHKMSPGPIKETASAVDDFCKQMLEKGVPFDQIYIVGSSGLRADNLIDLSNKVKEVTGRNMTFLEVSSEVIYTISGVVPKYTKVYTGKGKYRKVRRVENRGRSILIDIGSGNTKGGYQERISPTDSNEYRITTFGIPFGTKTLAEKTSKSLPADADHATFAAKARELSRELIHQPLEAELNVKPGLVNRPRVYLTGGITWALATLIHPENRASYVSLSASDIDRFYNEALKNPGSLLNQDLSMVDAGMREKVANDINSIQSTFTVKQLLAGAEIMRTLSEDLGFGERKTIRFARQAYIAWILRYVNLKSTETRETDCQ